MSLTGFDRVGAALPDWVPDAARLYLAHTENGLSLRALARRTGQHPSTVLRQVRRLEGLRDDPLVDAALKRLGALQTGGDPRLNSRHDAKGEAMSQTSAAETGTAPDSGPLGHEEQRVLRRLCETGAVLAVATDMDKAVVVRDSAAGSLRTAVVPSAVAQALALKGWIACDAPGRVSRYRITATGRQALAGMIGAQESRVRGLAEAGARFRHAEIGPEAETDTARKSRFALADSPLAALARRRDRDGTPFLAETLVSAGERLREDYELAQMTDSGLAAASGGAARRGASAARERLDQALADLGPGLSDVALRCCCQLEGLETAEKRLGWSARSGKVVLRIALQRLRRHYEQLGDRGAMIG